MMEVCDKNISAVEIHSQGRKEFHGQYHSCWWLGDARNTASAAVVLSRNIELISNRTLPVKCVPVLICSLFDIAWSVISAVRLTIVRECVFKPFAQVKLPRICRPVWKKVRLISGNWFGSIGSQRAQPLLITLGIFFLQNLIIHVIFLYKTGLIQWLSRQNCGYWWLCALAPGHQWPQSWVRTMHFPTFMC